jgi:hypothetical protein
MDVEADMRLHTEIFREGHRQTQEVTVKLDKDWFRVERRIHNAPKAITVRRYWDIIRQPMESTTAFRQLYLIKKALIDWPSMGAAIAKVAQKEFRNNQGAIKRLKKQTITQNNKIVKAKLDRAAEVMKEKNMVKSTNSDKKNNGKTASKSKKVATK